MYKIKAIETEYNGYKFRSRLEARWAVFFDYLGWEYAYEPEGFELGEGLRYLPDFLVKIPIYNYDTVDECYIEVKPDNNLSEIEERKLSLFSVYHDIILVQGVPDRKKILTMYNYDEEEKESYISEVCFDNEKFGIYYGEMEDCYSDEMLQAFKVAKQARFEFGEKG